MYVTLVGNILQNSSKLPDFTPNPTVTQCASKTSRFSGMGAPFRALGHGCSAHPLSPGVFMPGWRTPRPGGPGLSPTDSRCQKIKVRENPPKRERHLDSEEFVHLNAKREKVGNYMYFFHNLTQSGLDTRRSRGETTCWHPRRPAGLHVTQRTP